MAIWILTFPQFPDQGLLSRLGPLVDIQRLEAERANEIVRADDLCLCTGVDTKLLGNKPIPGLLQAGANLIILPPYPKEQPYRILPDVDEIMLRSIAFGSAKVLDVGLQKACGLEELVILHNQAFTAYPGTPVVVAASGAPVVVRYQYRSTWGSLVLVTLLIGSSSARSLRQHRVAFITGLVGWLGGTQVEVTPSALSEKITQDLRLLPIYPLLVLMVTCLPSERSVVIDDLILAFTHVQKRLGNSFVNASWDTNWMDGLEKESLVNKLSDSSWQVNNELLVQEVSRLHLDAYVRRLQ